MASARAQGINDWTVERSWVHYVISMLVKQQAQSRRDQLEETSVRRARLHTAALPSYTTERVQRHPNSNTRQSNCGTRCYRHHQRRDQ